MITRIPYVATIAKVATLFVGVYAVAAPRKW